MKNFEKRGASPLIATIVLIAFAVSLGGFIMSLGGFYYEKIRTGECTTLAISYLELEDKLQCRDFEAKSILNLYKTDGSYSVPSCYNETVSGTGKVCGPSKKLFENTWTISPNLIR